MRRGRGFSFINGDQKGEGGMNTKLMRILWVGLICVGMANPVMAKVDLTKGDPAPAGVPAKGPSGPAAVQSAREVKMKPVAATDISKAPVAGSSMNAPSLVLFTDINAGLQGMNQGKVAWGDYDNDGYLDILVSGYGSSGLVITKVYHNNHNDTFTENTNAILKPLGQSSAAWGDYDKDGFLDIALQGITDPPSYQTHAFIYHNNHDGTFTNIQAGLQPLTNGSLAWGDYDKDGYLDLLQTGNTVVYPAIIRSVIYHNNGNGTFTDINAALIGVDTSDAQWADYDKDGYLDIALSGRVATQYQI